MPSDAFELMIPATPVIAERPPFARSPRGLLTDRATRRLAQRLRLAWERAGRPSLGPGPYELSLVAEMPRPGHHRAADGSLTSAGRTSARPMRTPGAENALALTVMVLREAGAVPDPVPVASVLRRLEWVEDGAGAIRVSARGLRG